MLGEVNIWKTSNGTMSNTYEVHHSPTNSVAYSSNDRYIATGSEDLLIVIIDIEN